MAQLTTATAASSGIRNKAIDRYLFTYNVFSSLGWGYALGGTLTHLYREYHASSEPSALTKLKHAGRSVYASGMGKFVLALEGMAIQEIFQACNGWVQTSASTVASQVFARLFVLIYIVERSAAVSFPARPVIAHLHNHAPIETDKPRQAQKSAGYALLVCVWALAECTRYPYYALLYLKGPSTPIGRLTALFQYLRYTTFILLYPLGVGGAELTLFRKKLPPLDKLKAASMREKLDTVIVFLALLAWPKGVFTCV